MADPDRQFEEIAVNYAFVAFTISTVGACLYMVAIQYLLIKVHHSKQKVKSPTSLELSLGITALWVVHHVLDNIVGFLIDTNVSIVAPKDALKVYQHLREFPYNLRWLAGWYAEIAPRWGGIILLFYQVLTTWLIFQTFILVRETVIPLFRDIRQGNNQYIAVKLQSRATELFDFTQRLFDTNNSKTSLDSNRGRNDGLWDDEKSNSQVIRLKRLQTDIPEKGQRMLSWDLTIDKNALNEMKETLGPPGGFGELGFNVASDRVCFGAMGIGSTFNLTFVLDPQPSGRSKAEKRRRSR